MQSDESLWARTVGAAVVGCETRTAVVANQCVAGIVPLLAEFPFVSYEPNGNRTYVNAKDISKTVIIIIVIMKNERWAEWNGNANYPKQAEVQLTAKRKGNAMEEEEEEENYYSGHGHSESSLRMCQGTLYTEEKCNASLII